MVKYSLTKIESAAGLAVAVGDYMVLTGHPVISAIGYSILAGLGGYFGKHFITNSLATEKSLQGQVAPPG